MDRIETARVLGLLDSSLILGNKWMIDTCRKALDGCQDAQRKAVRAVQLLFDDEPTELES